MGRHHTLKAPTEEEIKFITENPHIIVPLLQDKFPHLTDNQIKRIRWKAKSLTLKKSHE